METHSLNPVAATVAVTVSVSVAVAVTVSVAVSVAGSGTVDVLSSRGRLTPSALTLRPLQEPCRRISRTRLEHFGVLSREFISGGSATFAFVRG